MVVNGIIYCAICSKTGMYYIGKTTRPLKKRINEHYRDAEKGKNNHFERSIRKYGKHSFTWRVLDNTMDPDELNALEQIYIEMFQSNNKKIGYNLMGGGQGSHHHEETKKKMSIARKGKKLSEEHKLNIGKANKGHSVSSKCRLMLSICNKGKASPMLGKNHTEESRSKMREHHLGLKQSEETKKKLSISLTGLKRTEDTKEKIRKSHLGHKNINARTIRCIDTNEVFLSMSEAQEKYKISYTNISACCRGKVKTAGKLHWEYANLESVA